MARKRKLLIIRECGISIRNVLLFQRNYGNKMYIKMNDDEFMLLINEFKSEKRRMTI